MSSEKTEVKPVLKVRAGSVSATVWKNDREKDGKKFSFHNTTLLRNYKDGEEWKTTNSFSQQDLVNVESVARKVREYLTVSVDVNEE